MPLLLDVLYLTAALVAAPWWLIRMIRTGKIRTDWRARFGRTVRLPKPDPHRPRVLIHAVSVGEVNSIRTLVDRLAPDHEVVIAATTDTGFSRAMAVYGPDFHVVRYPFDLSIAVARFLRAVQPDLVALVELEVWPNFTRLCEASGIPVVVVNGRISERSFPAYRRARRLLAPSFGRLAAVAVQDEIIADRFAALGVSRDRIVVAGTLKWDTAVIADAVPGVDELVAAFGLDRTRPIIVAGSTGPGEEALIHQAVPADVQLIVVPRKPERFDEAAAALPGCVRHSCRPAPPDSDRDGPPTRCLLDAMGKLRAAYALADLVIVGRSFVPMGGSDMIEPIGLGKPVVIGPHTQNFQAVMDALLEAGAVVQIPTDRLGEAVRSLLGDPARRRRLAEAGRAVILANRGATERNVRMIRAVLDHPAVKNNAGEPVGSPACQSHQVSA